MERINSDFAQPFAGRLDPLTIRPNDAARGVVIREFAECSLHGRFAMSCYADGRTSVCPQCLMAAEDDQRRQQLIADRNAANIRRAQALLERSKIPPRFDEATFDTYAAETPQQRTVLSKLREYAERFPEHYRRGAGLILAGQKGTGKTHLAIAAGREIAERHGMSFLFTTVARMSMAIRKTYGKGDKTEAEVYDALAETDLLIIDEIGVQSGSKFEENMLFEVINRRYEDRKPSILISNLALTEIGDALGERAIDRLRQESKAVVFDWASYRDRGAA